MITQSSMQFSNGIPKLHKFNPKGRMLDDILNMCSLFGYIFEPRHDKRFKPAPIIRNDENTRFGYLQSYKSMRVLKDFSFNFNYEGRQLTIMFYADTFLDYDELNDKCKVELEIGKETWVKASYFTGFGEDFTTIVDCVYYVYKNNVINLSSYYKQCLNELAAEKKEKGQLTKDNMRAVTHFWTVPALR